MPISQSSMNVVTTFINWENPCFSDDDGVNGPRPLRLALDREEVVFHCDARPSIEKVDDQARGCLLTKMHLFQDHVLSLLAPPMTPTSSRLQSRAVTI